MLNTFVINSDLDIFQLLIRAFYSYMPSDGKIPGQLEVSFLIFLTLGSIK
jgi:hypothetical protein